MALVDEGGLNMAKTMYKVKSNGNTEPLGMKGSLDERLLAIGLWFCQGDIDASNYLWCLEKAFEHWGWAAPKTE